MEELNDFIGQSTCQYNDNNKKAKQTKQSMGFEKTSAEGPSLIFITDEKCKFRQFFLVSDITAMYIILIVIFILFLSLLLLNVTDKFYNLH